MKRSDFLRLGGIVFILTISVSACQSSQTGRVIHQEGRNVIQLETDPSVPKDSVRELHARPTTVKPEELSLILRGLTVRPEGGLVERLLSRTDTAEAVFDDEEPRDLAPLLADGLSSAGPTDRAAFIYWSSKPIRRNTPIKGTIAVRGPDLRFTLDEHPAGGPPSPDDTSRPKRFTLGFVRPSYVKAAAPDDSRRNVGGNSTILIDYKRFLQDPTVDQPLSVSLIPDALTMSRVPAAKPPVPDATIRQEPAARPAEPSIQSLQQQIKELTDSNQELRRTIRELKDELAETKQLMADKVLELNRMKNKSGGKGKSQAPSRR